MLRRNREQWRALFLTLLAIGVVLFIFTASWGRMPGMGMMGRHHPGMMGGVPQAYAGRRNPLPETVGNLSAGGGLYRTNCALCHGETGLGNGPAGVALEPPPSNLRHLLRMPMVGDDYLFWVISEGGKRNGSAMPAFQSILKETERWQLIHFLRRL